MFWRSAFVWVRNRYFVLLLALVGLSFAQSSQAQKPVLRFLTDSVCFGQPVQAVLYCRHDPSEELLFPDSSFNYFPFEFVDKHYFPTQTVGNESLDSVVYTLRTFEDTSLYSLTLPVFLFKEKDTLRILSNMDELAFEPFFKQPSDSLKLISNTTLLPLERDFNYLIYLLIFASLILLTLLVYLLFGKRLLQQWKRYRMKIAHKQFITAFDSLTKVTNLSVADMEKALSVWKKYMESLSEKPYTTFTSAEIATQLKRENLKKNLQGIDAAIYGGRFKGTVPEDFEILRRVAIEEFIGTFRAERS